MELLEFVESEVKHLISALNENEQLVALSNMQDAFDNIFSSNMLSKDKVFYGKVTCKLNDTNISSIIKSLLVEKNNQFINHFCHNINGYIYFYVTKSFREALLNAQTVEPELLYSFNETIILYLKLMITSDSLFEEHKLCLQELINTTLTIWSSMDYKENWPTYYYCSMFRTIKLLLKLYEKLSKSDTHTLLDSSLKKVPLIIIHIISFVKLKPWANGDHLLWKYVVQILLLSFNLRKLSDGEEFVNLCLNSTSLLLSKLQQFDFLEDSFTGLRTMTPVTIDGESMAVCTSTGRLILIYLLNCLLVRNQKENISVEQNEMELSELLSQLHKFANIKNKDDGVVPMLVDIFLEQDEQLTEMLLLLLQLHQFLRYDYVINPHILMYKLLEEISFDETIFIDWLVSKETMRFNDYLTTYMKNAVERYDQFINIITKYNQLYNKKLNDSIQTIDKTQKVSISTLDRTHNVSISNGIKQLTLVDIDNKSTCLVDYSSSEDELSDDSYDNSNLNDNITDTNQSNETIINDKMIIGTHLDLFMSFFIRLRLKLDRLYEHIPVTVREGLLPFIEKLEDLYEM